MGLSAAKYKVHPLVHLKIDATFSRAVHKNLATPRALRVQFRD